MFEDRTQAGARLGRALLEWKDRDPVVLALPRGGVPVGYEIARALGAPLDLLLVRKVGAPDQPELAVAAVVDGEAPQVVRNESVLRALGLGERWLERAAERELAEIERRRERYGAGREPVPVRGRTAVVVDDGIATGATARAALRGVRQRGAANVVLAVPVAPPETLEALRAEVDALVCLETPEPFGAIGAFYRDFHQLSDDDVVDLLARASRATDRSA